MPRPPVTASQRRSGLRLGRQLRAQRIALGQTAESLARLTNCSIDTIRKIEQGKISNPGLFTVHPIARALDVDLDAVAQEALQGE